MPHRCLERQRLIQQVKEVIANLNAIHLEELESVSRGEHDLHFQDRLRIARELRASLLERLRSHVAEHHCG
jgi:hypothetical protein